MTTSRKRSGLITFFTGMPQLHTIHANNSLLGIDELKDRMKEVNKRNKCFNN
jgi:hypothetical protein